MDKIRAFFLPNRVAVYLTSIASLAVAVAAVWNDLDWKSTVGVLGSLATLAGIAAVWLRGWQADEQRQHEALQGVETAELPPKARTDVSAAEAAVTPAEQAVAATIPAAS